MEIINRARFLPGNASRFPLVAWSSRIQHYVWERRCDAWYTVVAGIVNAIAVLDNGEHLSSVNRSITVTQEI